MAKRERDSKGRFTANSTSDMIRRKASGRVKFDVVNLAPMPDFREKQREVTSKEIYKFGDDNLFPQYLAELKRKSSTHRAILSQKATYTAGSKITTVNAKLEPYIQEVNPKHQSLRNLFRLVVDDFYTFGNSYIEFVEYEGGCNMYHIDSTMVRVGKNLESVYINPDWSYYGVEDKKVRKVPMYPNFKNGRSVLMFKDYESGFQRYGIPDYIAAAESGSIEIDYLIQKYNRSKFENGFMPSAIIEIDGSMSDDEAEELISLAQDKLTGEGNNGKILFLVKDGAGAGSGSNVQILKDDKDGSFMEYQELTRNNIVTAHRWQPALSGIVSSGKMNNTGSEIRISYDLVMRTVIQDTIEQVFKPMRDAMGKVLGLDASSLEVQFESPIGFAADIDITQIADVNELRALIGLEERPDLEDIYLNDLKSKDDGGDRL